jgi:acetyl-CoA/propionyl-CoA carboxylase biotin carboxyl carrier protein
VRVDHCLVPGGRVSSRFDSLVAKVIGHGPDRATAIKRLRGALAELKVGQVPTTAGFLHHALG